MVSLQFSYNFHPYQFPVQFVCPTSVIVKSLFTEIKSKVRKQQSGWNLRKNHQVLSVSSYFLLLFAWGKAKVCEKRQKEGKPKRTVVPLQTKMKVLEPSLNYNQNQSRNNKRMKWARQRNSPKINRQKVEGQETPNGEAASGGEN